MRKMLIPFLTFALTVPAMAERFQDTIDSISIGQNGEDHLIFLQNGRVVFLDPNEEIPKIGSRIEVEQDEGNEIISIQSIPSESSPIEKAMDMVQINSRPTILENYSDLTNLFNRMNRSWKAKTECTDRAHIWSYEEWRRSNHISQKVFIFFTNTYIRRYRFNWWFHVSPYNLVKEQENTVEYVVDRRFSSRPQYMKEWTDTFIRSNRSCPTKTYRFYQNNKNGPEHCYIVKSNMYNRLPLHIRNEEDNGIVQDRFNQNEVNFSYRAFNRRNK